MVVVVELLGGDYLWGGFGGNGKVLGVEIDYVEYFLIVELVVWFGWMFVVFSFGCLLWVFLVMLVEGGEGVVFRMDRVVLGV